jgi:hypothetical protein
VTVSGDGAPHGTVRILPGGQIVGHFGGRRVTTRLPGSGSAARAAAVRAALSSWPTGYRAVDRTERLR